MKIFYAKRLFRGTDFYAINLFGCVFARGPLNIVSAHHEHIHTLQQREMLYIFFYLWYVVEWAVRFMGCRSWYDSYASLSFEREAYANQYNLKYEQTRRPYAWLHYLHGYSGRRTHPKANHVGLAKSGGV